MSLFKVVGPMANNVNQLYGDYAADVDSRYVKTPYEGLKMMATTVNYAAGCPDNKCVNYTSSDITKAIQGTQLVVVCVGTGIGFHEIYIYLATVDLEIFA